MGNYQYVVYLDVFFIINLLMDFLLVTVSGKVLKERNNILRNLAAGSLGGIYSTVIITTPLINHFILLYILNFLTAGLMVRIAFGKSTLKVFLKKIVVLYLITFLCGGILDYLYYSTKIGVIVQGVVKGNTYIGLALRKFLLITIISFVLLYLISAFIRFYKRNVNTIFNVTIINNGNQVICKGLYDTGNSLREPISNTIVHIAEQNKLMELMKGDGTFEKNICVIPYHSIGKEQGVLYGIRVEKMVIKGIENSREKSSSSMGVEEDIIFEKPILAIYKGKVSSNGDYSVILNRDTFE